MIEIVVPGFSRLQLQHLVLDYNGTLAVDGVLLPGVAEKLVALAGLLEIHVITADTFGLAKNQLAELPATLTILPLENQAEGKLQFVQGLGVDSVVAIGNDRKMLQAAALGLAVIQKEGASAEALAQADVVAGSIVDALSLLQNTKRLIATLRS